MKVKIYDTHGKTHGDADLKIQSSGASFQLIQDAVVTYRANQRQGNASTKTRGEVSGAGKKPWRQKGTGRARSGSIRSPLWRHGGIVHGPKPRDFSKTMPKKMKRSAFQNALVTRAEAGDVIVLKGLKLSSPKTREFAAIIEKLPLDGASALIIYGELDKNILLAGRNLAQLELVSAESLNIYQVLNFGKLIFTEEALEKVQVRVSGEKKEKKAAAKKGDDK
jgi:large subunit ribosomal protein L4